MVWDYKEKIMHGLKASSGLENSLRKNIFYKNIKDLFEQKFEHNVDCKWQEIEIIHKVATKIEVVHAKKTKNFREIEL